MAFPACRPFRLLLEGGRAELGSQGHLSWYDAVYVDSASWLHPAVYFPPTGALVTQSNVGWVNQDIVLTTRVSGALVSILVKGVGYEA